MKTEKLLDKKIYENIKDAVKNGFIRYEPNSFNNFKVKLFEERPYSKIYKIMFDSYELPNFIYKIPKNVDRNTQNSITYEFETMQYLYRNFHGASKYKVIKPVHITKNPLGIISEEIPGKRFSTIIKENISLYHRVKQTDLFKNMSDCAEWLIKFQKIMPKKNSRYEFIKEDFTHFEKQLKKIAKYKIIPVEILNKLKAYFIKKEIYNISEIKPVGVHSDFIPSNIIINMDNVAIVDFSNYKVGHPYKDVGSFLNSIEMYKCNPFADANLIEKLKKEFICNLTPFNISIDDTDIVFYRMRSLLGNILKLSMRSKTFYQKFKFLFYKKRIASLLKDMID